MVDRVEMSSGAMGIGGAAHMSSADVRAELLGRELTPLERAADDEADRYRDLREARHAIWLSQLSAKERKWLGITDALPLLHHFGEFVRINFPSLSRGLERHGATNRSVLELLRNALAQLQREED